jgi:hypothetical protein
MFLNEDMGLLLFITCKRLFQRLKSDRKTTIESSNLWWWILKKMILQLVLNMIFNTTVAKYWRLIIFVNIIISCEPYFFIFEIQLICLNLVFQSISLLKGCLSELYNFCFNWLWIKVSFYQKTPLSIIFLFIFYDNFHCLCYFLLP